MALEDAGCPLGRHELLDDEWLALGQLKVERDRILAEKAKAKREEEGTNEEVDA